jgi:hypothetical protein
VWTPTPPLPVGYRVRGAAHRVDAPGLAPRLTTLALRVAGVRVSCQDLTRLVRGLACAPDLRELELDVAAGTELRPSCDRALGGLRLAPALETLRVRMGVPDPAVFAALAIVAHAPRLRSVELLIAQPHAAFDAASAAAVVAALAGAPGLRRIAVVLGPTARASAAARDCLRAAAGRAELVGGTKE